MSQRSYYFSRGQILTCGPSLRTCSPKFDTFQTRHIVVAFDLESRALVASMSLSAALQRVRDGCCASSFAPAEMISQHIARQVACQQEYSYVRYIQYIGSIYLRLNVLEQNLQLYGLSPESASAHLGSVWDTEILRGGSAGGSLGYRVGSWTFTYVAVDVAGDVLCAGISCRTGCRSRGSEPGPFCLFHCCVSVVVSWVYEGSVL